MAEIRTCFPFQMSMKLITMSLSPLAGEVALGELKFFLTLLFSCYQLTATRDDDAMKTKTFSLLAGCREAKQSPLSSTTTILYSIQAHKRR